MWECVYFDASKNDPTIVLFVSCRIDSISNWFANAHTQYRRFNETNLEIRAIRRRYRKKERQKGTKESRKIRNLERGFTRVRKACRDPSTANIGNVAAGGWSKTRERRFVKSGKRKVVFCDRSQRDSLITVVDRVLLTCSDRGEGAR